MTRMASRKQKQRHNTGMSGIGARMTTTAARIGRALKRLMLVTLAMAGLVAVVVGLERINLNSRFPIRQVVLAPEASHVKPEMLQAALLEIEDRGFFTIDLEATMKAFTALPWVRSVSLRRVWPDELWVAVEEQQAMALYGDTGVLSPDGDIFYPVLPVTGTGLPRINGPEREAAELVAQLPRLKAALGPTGLNLARLDVSARGALNITLDNGLQLRLGNHDKHRRLQRFASLYGHILEQKDAPLDYVDLRYDTGLAVSWRTDPEQELAGQ